jgi:hypothetical protein
MKEIQLHRIDLNLLVVFEALMSEGSVAGAAERSARRRRRSATRWPGCATRSGTR